MEDASNSHGGDGTITVIMELVNGPLDGTTYIFEEHGEELRDFSESSMPLALYRKSRNGSVGEVLRPAVAEQADNKHPLSDFMPRSPIYPQIVFDRVIHRDHQYVITDCLADGNEVLVRAQYLCGPLVTSEILVATVPACSSRR